MQNKEEKNKTAGVRDLDQEEEEVQEEDEALMLQLEEAATDGGADDISLSLVEDQCPEFAHQQMPPLEQAEELLLPISRAEVNELKTSNDADYDPNGDQEEDDEELCETKGDDNSFEDHDENIVPDDWFFPGYMAFIAWGPFAEPVIRLRTVLITGLKKGDVKSRAEMRKEMKAEKI